MKENLMEIARELNIQIIGPYRVKNLWDNQGGIDYKGVCHFDLEKLRYANEHKKGGHAKPCIIYINPFSLFEQRDIIGWTFSSRGYTFFRNEIWTEPMFKEELSAVPDGGYYLFYNMEGVYCKDISYLNKINFKVAPLAVASQALINYRDANKEKKHFFRFDYHVSRPATDKIPGVAVGEFPLENLHVIFFDKNDFNMRKMTLMI